MHVLAAGQAAFSSLLRSCPARFFTLSLSFLSLTYFYIVTSLSAVPSDSGFSSHRGWPFPNPAEVPGK